MLALALLLALPAGQPLPEPLARRVDAVFAAYGDSTPGCALGVSRDGRVVHARGYGMADLERRVPITPGSVFDLGSTSKQVTALAIALLERDGKLRLDDEVRRHVPELPAYERPITIRHLLHHTSGLRDYLTLMDLQGVDFEGVTTQQDALDLVIRQRATNFAAGAEYLYSNTGYMLLSTIVERVAGHPLRAFAQHRIFGPLGLVRTHVHDAHRELVADRAIGYAPREGGGHELEMSGFEQTGDGAVYSNVLEWLAFAENYRAPKVGDRALVDRMQTPGALDDGQPIHYASGLMVRERRGLRTVAHGGSWAGYRAQLLRYPDQGLAIAVLCNVSDAPVEDLAWRIAEVVLEERMTAALAPATPPPGAAAAALVPLSPEQRAALGGEYWSDELEVAFGLVEREGALHLARPRRPAVAVGWHEPGVLAAGRLRLTVQERDGRVTGFSLGAGRVTGLAFTRR